MKYYFYTMVFMCGEYDFIDNHIIEIEDSKDIKVELDEIARSIYDDDDVEKENGWYQFNCGDVACKIESYHEITKEEYDVLNKYL